jgi:hypothetical protein
MNQRLRLQLMRNKYGPMKVARVYPSGAWSKHVDVLEATEKEMWDLLDKANNRQILQCEIVLDYDAPKDQLPNEVLAAAKTIAKKLQCMGIQYKSYFSGSRGYHFHMVFPSFTFQSFATRKKLRTSLIKKVGCDLMKSSDNTMIALEHAPHWKTGKPKTEVVL